MIQIVCKGTRERLMKFRRMMALQKNSIVGFWRGIGAYSKLSHKRRYVLMSTGIGDIVWFCAYYHAFLEYYEVQGLHLIVLKKFAGILSSFGIVPECIIAVKGDDIARLSYFARSKKYRNIISGQMDDDDISIRRTAGKMVRERQKEFQEMAKIQVQRLGLEMDVLYKYGYFNLPKEAMPLCFNPLQEYGNRAEQVIKDLDISSEDVLIIPYANTRKNMSDEVWSEIVRELKKQGRKVYTNCKDESEKTVEGTLRLVVPLEYIPYVVRKVKLTVSARCGLADLVYLAGGNLVVVHNIEGDNQNDYQYLAASLESFEGIAERCTLFKKQLVKDIRINNESKWKKQFSQIIQNMHKEYKGCGDESKVPNPMECNF